MKGWRMAREVLIAAAILIIAMPANAVPNRFATVDYPGAVQTFVYGINSAGDVVGAWDDTAGVEHGFVLRDGTFTSFDVPGAKWTDAYGITRDGQIVGQYAISSETGITHGFLLKNGSFSLIDLAGPTNQGAANSMPFGVMPDGTIVGCYHQSTSTGAIVAGTMHGFILRGTTVTFNDANTMHLATNTAGDVVGYGTGYDAAATADHGYLLSNGKMTWFSVPNSVFTRPRGIAANGDITGVYQDTAARKFHGFLYRNGSYGTIDVPGATATRPMGMNAQGDIVGYYTDANSKNHGFIFRKTGMWVGPNLPSAGFVMEQQNGRMMMMAFVYNYFGAPMWMTATDQFTSGTLLTGAHTFSGGQTMTGGYRAPSDEGIQGILQVQFADDGSASMNWTPNPFMRMTTKLQRFGFTGGPGIPGAAVESGFWSSPSEPGRTFSIEMQDNSLFIVGAMFDDFGSPTWYLSFGPMTDPMQYSGSWTQYGQGATMMGMGATARLINPYVGPLKIKFTDAQNGTLTLPDGRQIQISRVSF